MTISPSELPMTLADDKPTSVTLNVRDCVVLYRLLQHEYIDYDNREAHAVIDRIAKVAKNELAK